MTRVEEIEKKKCTERFRSSEWNESYHLEDISITLARICDALELIASAGGIKETVETSPAIQCPVCSKGFLEKQELKGTEVFRLPNAKCNVCGATTNIKWRN